MTSPTMPTYGTSPLQGTNPFETKASKAKQYALKHEPTAQERTQQVASGLVAVAGMAMPPIAVIAGAMQYGGKMLEIAKAAMKEHKSSGSYSRIN